MSIRVVGLSLSALFGAVYVLCVLWDLAVPGWAMSGLWQGLFPGFSWSAGGFVIGLVETVVYGFLAAVIFVPIYNALQPREEAAPREAIKTHEPLPHH